MLISLRCGRKRCAIGFSKKRPPGSHLLQPLGASVCEWLQVAAKWLLEHVAAKWLQVAASGWKGLPSGCFVKCLPSAASVCQVAALASGCKWLQVAAGGCKWPPEQMAASGCKWLQVAAWASGCKWLFEQVAIRLNERQFFFAFGFWNIVHNVPPGVIDSPGLCDTDLAKTCKNTPKQEQQQEEQQEEGEGEEEEEKEEEDKEQERIEQGEQWEQGGQDGEQNEEQEQEPQQKQEQETEQYQEQEHNHKNKTKNKSLTFDHPWCYAAKSCPWFSNSFDSTLSDHSLFLQSSGLLPCKIWSLTCKSLLLRSKILSLTFKHVGCYALRFCLSCP